MSYITYSEYPEWETQPSHWAGVYVHTYIHRHILWWRIHIELSAQQPIMSSMLCFHLKHVGNTSYDVVATQVPPCTLQKLRQESVCWRSAFRYWSW